jgi:hypothetical protein
VRKEPRIVSDIMTGPDGETYVIRAGQRIEVERPKSKARAPRRAMDDGFAIVPLSWAADFADSAKAPVGALIPLLAYLSWKEGGDTFRLSNEILARYGVGRWVKYRSLAQWEKDGLIRVLRPRGRAPIVTLLKTLKKAKRAI